MKYAEAAFTVNAAKPHEVVAIFANESGFRQVFEAPNEVDARKAADRLNFEMGVTPSMREAMTMGSMFGWDKPIADPDGDFAKDAKPLWEAA